MIIAAIVIVILIVGGIYFWRSRETFKPEPQQSHQQPHQSFQSQQRRMEDVPVEPIPPQQRRKQPALVLFHSVNCGACKRLAPVWGNVTKSLGNSIDIIEFEGTKHQQEVSKNQIKGFPTIRFYPQGYPGPFTEYQGDRSLESIMNFVKSGGVAY